MRVMRAIAVPILFALAGAARAQEKPSALPPRAEGFFKERRVLFWGELPQEPSSKATPGARGLEAESVWAEPIRMPDGRFSIYVPPKRVLEFLETPSEENARSYLAWQK